MGEGQQAARYILAGQNVLPENIPFFCSNRENRAPPSVLISIRQRWSDLRRRAGAPCGPVGGPGGPRATMKPRHLSQRRFLRF